MAGLRGGSEDARLTRQLALDLTRRTHGGARAGAGRPRKKDADRGFIAHRKRPSHRRGDPVHVTLAVMKRAGIPSLRRESMERMVRRCLLEQRAKLTKLEVKHFHVVHFTIQTNHLHLIVEANDKRALARGLAGLEVRIARRLNALLKRKGRFWAERYHRRDLRTKTETRNVLRYVLLNTHKHYRVIGDRAFADPHSSAATFDGFSRPAAIFDEDQPWPKVAPRTWLLGVGWRGHGLLDPAEIPSSSPFRSTPAEPLGSSARLEVGLAVEADVFGAVAAFF